jgi:curved DNA-binding protein CbpA
MEAGEAEISRIIRCPVSSKELIFRFAQDEKYTVQELRKRYKSLALLVHPDRCKVDGAESAFQILSNSFEILLSQIPDSYSEIHQGKNHSRDDVNKSSQQQKSNVPNSSDEAYPTAKSRNENDRSAKPSDHSSRTSSTNGGVPTSGNTSGDGKTRSSSFNFDAEWAQAEEDFRAESVEARISHELRLKRKQSRRNEADEIRASNMQAELVMQQEHVESRADKWRRWSSGSRGERDDKSAMGGRLSGIEDPVTVASSESSDNSNNSGNSNSRDHRNDYRSYSDNSNHINSNSTIDNNNNNININSSDRGEDIDITHHTAGSNGTGKNGNIQCNNQSCCPVCIICQRMFRSSDALRKHEEVSALHLHNILLQNNALELEK